MSAPSRSSPEGSRGTRRRRAAARGEAVVAGVTRVAERAPGYRVANAAIGRDMRAGGGLLAGALAFRLFGALLPLGLLLAVLLGYAATTDPGAPGKAADAVGIAPSVLESIAESSKLSTGTRWTVAAFAVVALVWSAMSAARAVRAAHSLAWAGKVERLGRPIGAGLVLVGVLVAFAAVWGADGKARADLGTGGLLLTLVSGLVFFAIWVGVAALLPHGDAPWTALIPGAVVVGLGFEVLHVGTVLFVADRLERASATYGSFGAAFTILVWLYVLARVIVASAMLNAALWHRRGEPADAGL